MWTKHIIFQKKKLSQKYQQQLQHKLQIALVEAETASAEAATAPAHSAVASTVVPEIEGSHKDYLTIFSQIMNLMPSFVLQAKDVINQLWQLWLTAVTVAPAPLSFKLSSLAKKQKTTYFVKDFSLFAKFPFN